MLNLQQLGRRICIMGCSCSGKSSLANQLATKLAIPAYHLDLLAHYPNTHWQRRPDAELKMAHAEIMAKDSWIIDGNYSSCLTERLANCSAVIWLDMSPLSCSIRYLKRCLTNNIHRAGRLKGAKHEFSLFLLKHILLTYPKNRLRYQTLLNNLIQPVVTIKDMRTLQYYYHFWKL